MSEQPTSSAAQLLAAGLALEQGGDLARAAACFQQAFALDPRNAEAGFHAGRTARETGQLAAAEALLRQALRFAPQSVGLLSELALTLSAQFQHGAAAYLLEDALKIAPRMPALHLNHGLMLQRQGLLDAAEKAYRKALALKPDYADVLLNLGVVLRERRDFQGAIRTLRHALGVNPRQRHAHNHLGASLIQIGRVEEALACIEQALVLDPRDPEAAANRLFIANYLPDAAPEKVFAFYREHEQRQFGAIAARTAPHRNLPDPQRRLRVGYVSPDFRNHAVAFFVEPLLARHDRAAVEVFAYAEVLREDTVTERMRAHVNHWRTTVGMSDEALARQIEADGIDVLVDLAGHTLGNRLGAFARKPAPVSVSWLGYGYTTGLSTIDYFLADAVTAPPGCEHLFAESVWRLPVPPFVFRPPAAAGPVGPLPALRGRGVTFGSLSRAVRLNDRVLRTWAALLKRVPGSRLALDSQSFADKFTRDEFAERFGRLGIERKRLVMGYHTPPWDTLRTVDIGLDCFPHNSGTTLFDSLHMGIPYVTLADRPSVGRIGSSVLHGLGHPEWIAASEDEYVEKAAALAGDLAALGRLRAALRQALMASPLMDEAGFARQLEGAYRSMWQRWCAGRQDAAGGRAGAEAAA